MLELVLNEDHLTTVLGEVLSSCRHRLFIATADVKDVHVPAECGPERPPRRRGSRSIIEHFERLCSRGVEIRLLHSGVPSGPLLKKLKQRVPRGLTMRRCPRAHIKAIVAEGRRMYLGSANLTGAGLGAKSPRRRNFEAGLWTDDVSLIDPVVDMLDGIWNGHQCRDCGRKQHCPVPLEEPKL